MCTNDDIRCEQAEQAMLTLFEGLIDNAPMGIFLVDTDFRIVRVNPVAMPVFGDIPNLIGSNFEYVMRVLFEKRHADDMVSIFHHTLETGEPFHTPECAEMRVDRGVMEYYEWRVNRITLRDGRYGVVCYFRDISEQVVSRQVIAKSEVRYRTLFNSIDEGFCVVQVIFEGNEPVDHRFVEINPAFEEQTGIKNALGKRMREITPQHEDHWFRIYGKVALTGEPLRFVKQAEALGRWFDVYAFRIGEPHEHTVAILFSDITQRKQAEHALREADRQKDEFLAMLAHELRNPLAPIRMSAGILRGRASGDPLITRCREIIERQTNQMSRLLEDLLDVSRLSRGKLELRRAPVALRDVLDAAVETSRPIIDQQEQRLTVGDVRSDLLLNGDAARLTQVFANLLSNAAKYGHRGGQIDVSVQERHDGVEICVRDNGIGIAPEVLGRIFDLFAQGSEARRHAPGGLGIGLSLARRLVEMHGGKIRAASAGIGRGSEFTVLLPAISDQKREAAAEPGQAVMRLPPLRVLVVDDNADAADTCAMLLEGFGCSVKTVYDGESAVREAEHLHPDVVLLDLGMAGVDGYEACRRIRHAPWGKKMRLIALSGWGQDEDRHRSKQAGFDVHLVKPVNPDTLVQVIRDTGRDVSRPHAPTWIET
jgi:PAS domain S-box-containing protein